MEKLELNGYAATLIPSPEQGCPCVIVMGGSHENGTVDELSSLVAEGTRGRVSLCRVQVPDWDGCLSPWEAEGAGQHFSGHGAGTLGLLEGELREYLFSRLGRVPLMIAGYSLAGLFSLWAYLVSDAFTSCASCSGSLWFPGFEDMASKAPLREGSRIYLSLGGKESSSPDPLMATVGDVHERLYRRFRSDPAVGLVRYDRNPGGHFRDPEKRLAKGIVWMVENDS